MSESTHSRESTVVRRLGAPRDWVRLVGSVWFDPSWYQSNIRPRIDDPLQAKWLAVRMALGATLVSLLSLMGMWVIGQAIESRVRVESSYLGLWALFLGLGPIVYAVIGVWGKRRTVIPAAIIAVVGVASVISMLGALVVLVFVPARVEPDAASGLAQIGIYLDGIVPMLSLLCALNLMAIDQEVKPGTSVDKFLRVMRNRNLRLLLGVLWMMTWAGHGAATIYSSWRYSSPAVRTIAWMPILSEAIIGLLYIVAVIAWHGQARAQHGVQPTLPSCVS